MKAAGIVAEYNPLHNGHVYHISRTRELTGCDAVVVAMSGNFVQRGMPAVWDKWTRAEHALRNGADLVLEIPVLHCLADAGRYASAGVRLIESTGIADCISFGSESGDAELLTATSDFIRRNIKELRDGIKALRTEGLSYPAAREKMFIKLGCPDGAAALLNSPNDILALEYILAMEKAEPIVIRREGAGYNDGAEEPGCTFMSATGIRAMLDGGKDISPYVPECVACTAGCCEQGADVLFDLVRFALLGSSGEDIDDCPSGGEGLGNLLKKGARSAGSLDELIMSAKSRRYTYTRISRLCMQILLGIKRNDFASGAVTGPETGIPDPGYIRVLGFTDAGRELLSEIKREKTASLPVLTNINKEAQDLSDTAKKMLDLDIHASDIYNLIRGNLLDASCDQIHKPVISFL